MDAFAASVRTALLRHGYTLDRVIHLVGEDAFLALGRGRTAPIRRALAACAPDALTDLIRLFLLGEDLPVERARGALPLEAAAGLGLLALPDDILARPMVLVQPYPTGDGDGFVVSDFPAGRGPTPLRLPDGHVIGVGAASVTLATLTARRAVARTLDLGAGCGIQALLAADHSAAVTATDISDRALKFAALTASLSGVAFDIRRGPLFEPVTGEQFDLIVANPPFVMSPQPRYVYREASQRGDDLSRDVVAGAAAMLAPGGLAVMLCNWLHVAGQPWQERLASWAPADCQMWVAQRELLTPAQYAELWLQDSAEAEGPEYEQRYAQWLDYFEQLHAAAIGFGWVVLRRSGTAWFVAEDVAEAERLPTGEEVLAQLDDYAAMHQSAAIDILRSTPSWAEGVELHRSWLPADPLSQEVYASRSWRPAERIDPVLLDLLVGHGSLDDRIDAAAGADADDLTVRALLGVRRLLGTGMLVLAG